MNARCGQTLDLPENICRNSITREKSHATPTRLLCYLRFCRPVTYDRPRTVGFYACTWERWWRGQPPVDRRRSVLTNAPRWIYVAVYQTRDENVSEVHNETNFEVCGFQQRARKICDYFWNSRLVHSKRKQKFMESDLNFELSLSVLSCYKKRGRILCYSDP